MQQAKDDPYHIRAWRMDNFNTEVVAEFEILMKAH